MLIIFGTLVGGSSDWIQYTPEMGAGIRAAIWNTVGAVSPASMGEAVVRAPSADAALSRS